MEAPEVYNLRRIRWQLFGTLTFRSESLPNSVHLKMWFAHARKTCATFGIYFPSSLWCLRQERGEATGRRHFHYLFGGLPEKSITMATCFAQMAQWESLGGGMARVRIFNRALNGTGYVSKGGASVAADVYETEKFGLETSEVMLSKGARAMLRRAIREDRRRIEQVDKRFDDKRQINPSVKSQGFDSGDLNRSLNRKDRIEAAEVLRQKWAKTVEIPGTLRSVQVDLE